jgi:hypothetical protein
MSHEPDRWEYPTAAEEAGEERLRDNTALLAADQSPIPCQRCGALDGCDACAYTGITQCEVCEVADAVMWVGKVPCCSLCAPGEMVAFARRPRRVA